MDDKTTSQTFKKVNLNLKDVLNIPYDAFYVDDILEPELCQAFIDISEAAGYSRIQTSKFNEEWSDEALRTNECAHILDDILASALFQKVAFLLPGCHSLNPLMRFGKFTRDQMVQPHVDGSLEVNGLASHYTLVFYLSDVPSGGETRFLNVLNMHSLDVKPKRGRLLVFDHSLCHAALPVGTGCKYTLRTDALFKTSGCN